MPPHRLPSVALRAALAIALTLLRVPAGGAQATPDIDIYTDALGPGWSDWSWTDRVLTSTAVVHSGTRAAAVTFTAPWAGFYLHSDTPLPGPSYERLDFWVHGGTAGGQRVRVVVNGDAAHAVDLPALVRGWTRVSIPLRDIGSPPSVQDLYWQDVTGTAQATFHLDDIVLVAGAGTPPPPPGVGPDLTVDVTADRAPIDPNIYGMNFADESLAQELALPLNRWGGNATTRYNWRLDVQNRGSDWFFENIPNDVAPVSQLPSGSTTDLFVDANRARGTQTLLTVPTIGWTPRTAAAITCGFSVGLYGAQAATDPYRTDCGNGQRPDGSAITGNDPTDTSQIVGPVFVTDWMAHLRQRVGDAANGGVRYYALDNEPDLWDSTHRDVHPQPVGYDELLTRTLAYARAIKTADAGARVLGPDSWGWVGYFYSAADVAAGGSWWTTRPDRRAHGDVPLIEWYLQQMRAASVSDGRRLLDVLDLHYYPQANGVALQGAGSLATQDLRLRSTRSLWDPSYADESWIAGSEGGPAAQLIPRMRAWVTAHYPGTAIGLTEYNFGGLEHINGALTQADVLGIFGREGLDLATLWAPPSPAQPGAFAFRMFRNYDGNGGRFGDLRVRARSVDQGALSIYAAERTADRTLTIVVVNKTRTALTTTLTLDGTRLSARARAYRYSDADLTRIVSLPAVDLTGPAALTLPAQSITLLAVPLGPIGR